MYLWAICPAFFPKASQMLGFSFGLLCREGSETEASTSWTERKPWEIAHGESFAGRERACKSGRKDDTHGQKNDWGQIEALQNQNMGGSAKALVE